MKPVLSSQDWVDVVVEAYSILSMYRRKNGTSHAVIATAAGVRAAPQPAPSRPAQSGGGWPAAAGTTAKHGEMLYVQVLI